MSLALFLSLSFLLFKSCLLITLIKCLKGHKSLGSLFVCQSVKYPEWVSEWVSDWVTRSPIELFWTAKKEKESKAVVWNVGFCFISFCADISQRISLTEFIPRPFPQPLPSSYAWTDMDVTYFTVSIIEFRILEANSEVASFYFQKPNIPNWHIFYHHQWWMTKRLKPLNLCNSKALVFYT